MRLFFILNIPGGGSHYFEFHSFSYLLRFYLILDIYHLFYLVISKYILPSYIYDSIESRVRPLLVFPLSSSSLRALRNNMFLRFQSPEIIPLPSFLLRTSLLNPPLKQGTPLVKLRLWHFLSSYWNSEIAPVVADSYPLYILSDTS